MKKYFLVLFFFFTLLTVHGQNLVVSFERIGLEFVKEAPDDLADKYVILFRIKELVVNDKPFTVNHYNELKYQDGTILREYQVGTTLYKLYFFGTEQYYQLGIKKGDSKVVWYEQAKPNYR